MVVLADPVLEAFFDVDLPQSFRLEPVEDPVARRQQPGQNLLNNVGGFLSQFVTDDSKKLFNNFVDDMGKAIGKHQVSLSPRFRDRSSHLPVGYAKAFYWETRKECGIARTTQRDSSLLLSGEIIWQRYEIK